LTETQPPPETQTGRDRIQRRHQIRIGAVIAVAAAVAVGLWLLLRDTGGGSEEQRVNASATTVSQQSLQTLMRTLRRPIYWAGRAPPHHPRGVLAPAFARYLQVRFTGLKRDLDHYLHYYNHERAHTGRLTQGRIPAEIVYGAPKVNTR
jgi:hypothetical protein